MSIGCDKCIECFLIDYIRDGVVIRKRRFKRISDQVSSIWLDYKNDIITDQNEITRLENEAVDSNRVDCLYPEYTVFTNGWTDADDISDLPVTDKFITASIPSDVDNPTVEFKKPGFEGDQVVISIPNDSSEYKTVNVPTGNPDNPYVEVVIPPNGEIIVDAEYKDDDWVYITDIYLDVTPRTLRFIDKPREAQNFNVISNTNWNVII